MNCLENLSDLDMLKVTGLIEICKVNRDYIQGYALYSKEDFYRVFEILLHKQIKINIPDIDEKHFKHNFSICE